MSELFSGLETSVVSLRAVLESASTARFDPEYFQKQHLADVSLVKEKPDAFRTLRELGIEADASAFYPSIEEFYESGELPFYRVGDVNGVVDVERATRIPAQLCIDYPTLKRVAPGDILFTKGGAIDRTGYVVKDGAVSRDLIFLKTSALRETRRLTLFSYFRTPFFRRMLLRSSSQTAQPHLTLTLVRDLPVFLGTSRLEEGIAAAVIAGHEHVEAALVWLQRAERILLAALGLDEWNPPEPLSYTARARDLLSARRMDAQYFRPLFAEVQQRLLQTGRAVQLGTILTTNLRGRQPQYSEHGLPVINSRHVRKNRVILGDNRVATETGSPVIIENGDVLVNGTGVGTIGRAAPYLHDQRALPDNHVTVLRTNQVDPIFLAAFLNSKLGQWQIERQIKGSSGQIELYSDDIAKIVFWDAPNDTQIAVKNAALSAFAEEHLAQERLDAAVKAVEIAIEKGEAAALAALG